MANVKVTLTGDEQRLLRSLDKVIAKEKELARKAADTGKASAQGSRTAAGARDKAFGQGAVNQLVAYAAGMASISTATQKVIAVFKEMERVREEAAQRLTSQVTPMGKLAQLAAGDEAEMARMMAGAKRTSRETGASIEQAADIQFQVESAGAGDERGFFAKFAAVEDVAPLITAAGKVRSAMGEQETGNLHALTSKALAAAAKAPGAGAADIMTAMTKGATPAKELGLSDEELAVMVSILAQKTESAETAGTQATRTLEMFDKWGLKGMDFHEMMKEGQRRIEGLSGEEQQELMPNVRARAGFRGLLDDSLVKKRLAAIREAEATDLAGRTAGLIEKSPELAEPLRTERLRRTREQTERAMGLDRLRTDQGIEQYQIARRDTGGYEFKTQAVKMYAKLVRPFVGEEQLRKAMGGGSTDYSAPHSEPFMGGEWEGGVSGPAAEAATQQLTEAMKENTAAIKGITSTNRNRGTE